MASPTRGRARRSLALPPWLGAAPPLVQEWAAYLTSRRRRPNTIRGYVVDLRQFIEWLDGTDALRVTQREIERYSEVMAHSELSPRSQARRLAAIRQFYKYLVRAGRLAADPASWVELPKIPKSAAEWLTSEEVGRLRQVIADDVRGTRDAALIELGLCGLRVFEATGITLGGVYLDRLQVRFTQKGGDIAYHHITPAAAEALTEWLRVRPQASSDALFVPLPPRGPKPQLTPRSAERIVHHYVTLAGIPKDVTFHTLRHTVGQKLADMKTPIQDIQDYLRHKHPATTRIYVERSTARLDEVARQQLHFPVPAQRPARSMPRRARH